MTLAMALLVPTACGGGEEKPPTSGPQAEEPRCPDGLKYWAEEGVCRDVYAAECPAGTMPEWGSPQCHPVGWTSCKAPFVVDPLGWGCAELLPDGPCQGATRADLASGACIPVGDCAAPFPPPDASFFVDDGFVAGDLDEHHFDRIQDAVAAAPAGAVVAVEAGLYEGSVFLTKPVTLVGRCAERVVVRWSGEAYAGLVVGKAGGVSVRGLTITGFSGGALLEGGEAALEDVILHGNQTAGLVVRGGGEATLRRSRISSTSPGATAGGDGVLVLKGSVLVEDASVVDNAPRNMAVVGAGSTLVATRLLAARNGAVADQRSGGIYVDRGSLELNESVIVDARGWGIFASGGKVRLDGSIVRRARGKLADGEGVGVLALDGSDVSVRGSGVVEHPAVGLYAGGGAHIRLERSVVRGPEDPGEAEFGRGLQAAEGAEIEVEDAAFIDVPQSGVGLQAGARGSLRRVLVRGAYPVPMGGELYGGFGVLVEEGSDAVLERVSIVDSTLSALSVTQGATAFGARLLLLGTRELPLAGVGSGLQVAAEARLTLEDSTLADNVGTSVIVAGGASLHARRAFIRRTTTNAAGLFGHGIAVFEGSSVELDDTAISANPGVGCVADGGRGAIAGGLLSDNGIALHVQNGSFLTESDDAGDVAAAELRVSRATRFEGNLSKVGSGLVPLPSPTPGE